MLLDTCVLSEFTRREPEERVIAWLDSMAEEDLFLSAVTVGEIQRGIERLPESGRKNQLQRWLADELIGRFGQRILLLDAETMLLWGSLTARMDAAGKPMSIMDALIAATAVRHNLTVATRNTTDFQPCGVQVFNPWK